MHPRSHAERNKGIAYVIQDHVDVPFFWTKNTGGLINSSIEQATSYSLAIAGHYKLVADWSFNSCLLLIDHCGHVD